MSQLIEWSRLDAAGFRVSIHRSVRRLAWFEAILGAIAAICGFAAPFLPLAVIGVALVVAGVWNLYRTSVNGVLVDGAVMILAGAFNCLLSMWLEDARASSVGKGIFAGVAQIVWGVRRLAVFPQARSAPNDPEAIAALETIIRDLAKRDPKEDATVVEFRTGGWRRRRNRIGLYAEGSVALLEHQAVRLERRADIWIEQRGTTMGGRTLKVGIQMSDLLLTGQMSADHFQRFERWKLGMAAARPVAA